MLSRRSIDGAGRISAEVYANVVDRRSFDAWGKLRNLTWRNDTSLLNPLYITQLPYTNKGYTGHEHIQEVGLIHMNGRVYDATLGRFLSADTFIQAGCVAFTALSSYAVSGDFGMALKAGVITAVTIQASAFIKANIGKTAGLIEQTVKRAVAHGVVGGTVNVVNGGKFGTGFMSSFVTKLASPGIQGLSEGVTDGTLSKVWVLQ